jgi:hypothetical protein
VTALALEPLNERTKGVVLGRSAQNLIDAYARANDCVARQVERRSETATPDGDAFVCGGPRRYL